MRQGQTRSPSRHWLSSTLMSSVVNLFHSTGWAPQITQGSYARLPHSYPEARGSEICSFRFLGDAMEAGARKPEFRLENQLHPEQQATAADSIRNDVAGKRQPTIAVEVCVLEAASGDVIQNWIRNSAELNVQHVEGLCLELGSHPLRNADVLEERQIGGAYALSAKRVSGATGERCAVDDGSVWSVLNPAHRARRDRRTRHEILQTTC